MCGHVGYCVYVFACMYTSDNSMCAPIRRHAIVSLHCSAVDTFAIFYLHRVNHRHAVCLCLALASHCVLSSFRGQIIENISIINSMPFLWQLNTFNRVALPYRRCRNSLDLRFQFSVCSLAHACRWAKRKVCLISICADYN